MGQPRIVEVDYFQLRDKLRAATTAGKRIDRTDRARWDTYLRDHAIDEVAVQAWAKVKFQRGKPILVIVDQGDRFDGLYAYSEGDEAALKWEPGSGDGPA